MKNDLKQAYRHELAGAHAAEQQGGLDAVLQHLARAHILSQRFALAHTAVHLRMLRVGWLKPDAHAIVGQLTRSIAALVFSRLWAPVGNTGLANVSAFRPMPVPDDLARYL